MPNQLGSLFSIAPSDLKFLRRQVNAANIKIIRYDVNGQPIYGYVDINNIVHELGLLGTFNPLEASIYVNAPIHVQSALDPLGTRTISGVFNNLNPGRYTWGATNQPFLNLTKPNYSNYVGQNINNPAFNPGRFGPGTIGFQDYYQTAANGQSVSNGIANSSALYANPFKTVVDYTPRMISQTVSSQAALNRLGIATDIDNSLSTSLPFIRSQRSDRNTNQSQSGYSGVFVLFGQYFDHGLDFIEKGGNIGANGKSAKIVIPLSPNDPLYNPAQGVTSMTISRATVSNPLGAGADGKFGTADDINPGVDGKYGTADDKMGPVNPIYINHTSPYADLSQAYGSDQQITQLLRQWVEDPNNPGHYIAGANLLTGNTLAQSWNFVQADGSSAMTRETLPTLKELRVQLLATGRDDLTWEDIQNYRVRDDQGRVLDADPNQAGIQTIFTGQAILLDLNPHFDAARIYQNGTTKDTTGILAGVELSTSLDPMGLPTTITVNGTAYSFSKYINPTSFAIQSNLSASDGAIANELLLRSVSDHYVAGDGRLNENFGLTTLHHVFHENHVFQLNSLESTILKQQSQDSSKTYSHDWQVAVNARVGAQLSQGVSIVNGHYEDTQGNYVTPNGGISWNQDKLFEAARLINQTEYQHIVFEYARFVTPDIPKFRTYNPNVNADIALDYAQAAFRYGHSQLRETIDYLDPNGSLTADVQKFALKAAFLNPNAFSQVGPASVALGMARQVGNETDEFITPALQQTLLGQALDLSAINIARGRDLGLATLNDTRKQLHDALVAERAASPAGGLKGEYFDNKDFTNLKVTRTDAQVNFNWGLGSPDSSIGSDTFSVRWTGQVKAEYTESYTFYTNADDGVRLWVNGQLLIDNFTDQVATERSSSISLEAGQKYDIKMEYYENGGYTNAQLSWSSAHQAKQIIPSSQLYSTTSEYPELHGSLKVEDLNPYMSWNDFSSHMIHPESLVNFIAAYSFDGDLSKAQAIAGLDKGTILEGAAAAAGFTKLQATNFLNGGDQGFNKIDLWIGGLAEKHVSGGILGTTFNTIFSDQLERLQDGDRLYYLYRLDSKFQEARGLLTQIESEQFKDMIERTTGARHLQGDVFEYVDNHIELGENAVSDPKNEHKYGGLAAVTQQALGVHSTSGFSTASNGIIVNVSGQQYVLDVRPDSGSTLSGSPAKGFNSDEVIGGTNNNDYIVTGGGNNTVYGEAGHDIIDGGDRAEFLYGGTGNDVIFGRGGDDFMDGGTGDDYLYGDDGADQIIGGDGNDVIYGGNGDDEVFAGAGNDYIDAGSGSNRILGGDGYDTVYEAGYHLNYKVSFSDQGKWQIRDQSGGDGTDTLIDVEQINFGSASVYYLVLTGTDGNDSLSTPAGSYAWSLMYGGDGNDTLNGTIGNDNLAGGAGNDLINGGDGYDIAHYDRVYTDYKFSLANGNLQVKDQVTWNGDDGTDTLINVEKIKLTDGEYQIVKGGVGNDSFNGSSDTVLIDGGAGIDTVDYSSYTGGVNVNLATNTVSYTSSPRTTLLTAIEQVTGSQGNDVIVGDAANNLLSGGAGNDNFTGGAGNDLINGGADYDNVYESGIYFNYKVSLDSNENWQIADQNGTDGTDTLINVEQINFLGGGVYSVLTGTAGNDAITAGLYWSLMSGGAGNDNLTGGAGNDLLNGGAGNDLLNGGAGNDFLNGGAGYDIVSGYGSHLDYAYSLDSSGNWQIADQSGTDTLIDVEQINFSGGGVYSVFTGTAGNDYLTTANWSLMSGGAGNDNLMGGVGRDYLSGAGNGSNGVSTIDTLTGGFSNDIFILGLQNQTFYDDGVNNGSSYGNADYAQITDFTLGDKIQLTGSAANYTLVNNVNIGGLNLGLFFLGGQTGIGLYRNNNGGATGSGVYSSPLAGSIGGNDDLIGLIQGSAANSTLNLGNSASFSYV
jgi:Ca2+-binding RTX toxin-like protein